MKNERSNIFLFGFAIAFIILAVLEIFADFGEKLIIGVSFCSFCISLGELMYNGKRYGFRWYARNFLYVSGIVGLLVLMCNAIGDDFLNINLIAKKFSNILTIIAFSFLFLSFRKTDASLDWRRFNG